CMRRSPQTFLHIPCVQDHLLCQRKLCIDQKVEALFYRYSIPACCRTLQQPPWDSALCFCCVCYLYLTRNIMSHFCGQRTLCLGEGYRPYCQWLSNIVPSALISCRK